MEHGWINSAWGERWQTERTGGKGRMVEEDQ